MIVSFYEAVLRGPWREDGLLLVPGYLGPEKRPKPAGEAQYIRSRISYSDLFGQVPTWEQFFDRLRDIGLRSLMNSFARVNSTLQVMGTMLVQDRLVQGMLDADLLNRIVERVPHWRGAVVYSPVQVMLAMKAAIVHSPDREDDRDDAAYTRALAEVLLMANDLVDADLPAMLAGVTGHTETATALLPHTIRSSFLNFGERFEYASSRASIMFTKVATRDDLRSSADFIDLHARFQELTGLSIADYFAIGSAFAIWFSAGVRGDNVDMGSINPSTFFSKLTIERSVAVALLNSLTQDLGSVKAAFEERAATKALFSYDFVPFMRRPLYQIREDVIVPTSVSFLEARVTTGVYWTLFDSMTSDERLRLTRFYGQIVETYVREAVLRTLPEAAGLAQRAFRDFVYETGQGQRRTSDVVALYPEAAIFFEVTATRLRLEATILVHDPVAVHDDFQRIIVKKAEQLHDRIEDFRRERYAFGDVKAAHVKTILPVIVVGESIPIWTTTMIAVRQALADRGLLQGAGIAPLRVVGVDEIEMVEGLVSAGQNMFNILAAHARDKDFKNMSLRNYLIRRFTVPMNETVRAEFMAMCQHSARLLFDETLR